MSFSNYYHERVDTFCDLILLLEDWMLASLLSLARGEGVLIFPAPARDTDPRGDMVWGVEGDLDLGRVLHVMLPRGESLLVMLPRGDSQGLEN